MVLLVTAVVAAIVAWRHLVVEEESVAYHAGVAEKKHDSFKKNATAVAAKKSRKKKQKETATTENAATPEDDEDDDETTSDEEEIGELFDSLLPTQKAQIESFRKGTGLIVNIHPTHHAGTTFCFTVGKAVGAPAFACMRDKQQVAPDPPDCQKLGLADGDPDCKSFNKIRTPFQKEETGSNIHAIVPYFRMVSWEYSAPVGGSKSLDDTDWAHPNLVSVVITRDPLSRLLAGDGQTKKEYPGYNKGGLSRKGWWDYAVYDNNKNTDNFFLRIWTTTKRKKRTSSQQSIQNHIETRVNRTTEELMDLFPTGIEERHFNHGKALLDQFTFVLDVECLDDGMDAVKNLLGIDPELQQRKSRKKAYAPTKERIGYEDVYEYLAAKNEWDIALYEYSKTISLVKC
jgi:hypothetical protein